MILFFVGTMCGLLIATIIFIGAYSFRTEIKKTANEVKKVLPNGKATFLEPEELTEKINRYFTK